jgi:hypothetical protein
MSVSISALVPQRQTADPDLADLDEQSRLLGLPPEIRNIIYEFVLTSETPEEISRFHKPYTPSLLRVCHQIRNETRLITVISTPSTRSQRAAAPAPSAAGLTKSPTTSSAACGASFSISTSSAFSPPGCLPLL